MANQCQWGEKRSLRIPMGPNAWDFSIGNIFANSQSQPITNQTSEQIIRTENLRLVRELSVAKFQLGEKEKLCTDLESRNRKTDGDLSEADRKNAVMARRNKSLTDRLTWTRTDLESSTGGTRNLQLLHSRTAKENSELRSIVTKSSLTERNTKQKLSRREQKIKELEATIKKMTDQNARYKKIIADLRKKGRRNTARSKKRKHREKSESESDTEKTVSV